MPANVDTIWVRRFRAQLARYQRQGYNTANAELHAADRINHDRAADGEQALSVDAYRSASATLESSEPTMNTTQHETILSALDRLVAHATSARDTFRSRVPRQVSMTLAEDLLVPLINDLDLAYSTVTAHQATTAVAAAAE